MSKLFTKIYRGDLIESFHEIKCYIGSVKGEKIFSTNNEKDLIYPRSSIKIFQGIPFYLSNAIELYGLNKKQTALACSSHCGEVFHVKELKKWLRKTNLKVSDLKCGIHNPLHKKSSEEIFLSGNMPTQIYNNCSGKHLAMLTSCKANNFSTNNYFDFNHPHQQNIRSVFSDFMGEKIPKKNYGIDGCSAPQYAFEIKSLVKGLTNLLESFNGNFEYSNSVKYMINAILANPKYIGGTNNLDSNLIKISNKKIFCKGGAEGVFLFAHIKKGIVGILKVKDGNERALPSAVYSLCKKFKILNREELDKFNSWIELNLFNHAKVKIGSINTIIK